MEVSVTTSPGQILQNIRLDLEGGYRKVLVVCIDTETVIETRKLAKEKLSKD